MLVGSTIIVAKHNGIFSGYLLQQGDCGSNFAGAVVETSKNPVVWSAMPVRYQYTLHGTVAQHNRLIKSSLEVHREDVVTLLIANKPEAHHMVSKLFPLRPCSYVRDSRHRLQNNVLRALGASNSGRQPTSTPTVSSVERAATTTPQRSSRLDSKGK